MIEVREKFTKSEIDIFLLVIVPLFWAVVAFVITGSNPIYLFTGLLMVSARLRIPNKFCSPTSKLVLAIVFCSLYVIKLIIA